MKNVFIHFLYGLGILVCFAVPGFAQGNEERNQGERNQVYFTVLTDVPVMPGMVEITDQAFVFDKAEGRVVEVVGFLSLSSSADPVEFYKTVLPELGWKPLKTGVFQRNNEQLVVRAEKLTREVLVRFQLSPLSR